MPRWLHCKYSATEGFVFGAVAAHARELSEVFASPDRDCGMGIETSVVSHSSGARVGRADHVGFRYLRGQRGTTRLH
jgi:hypothetical protein